MRILKRVLLVLLALMTYLFLDYALPSNDIIRVTDAYSRITTIGANRMFYAEEDVGGGADHNQGTRDVRFVSGEHEDGTVKVYRNEDTGWVWPPYFKYDSSNLQAEFSKHVSPADKPMWIKVTSYGWRVAWLSIYPNAISVTPVAGPQESTISLLALSILLALYWVLVFIHRLWFRFMHRSVRPAIEDMGEVAGDVIGKADIVRDRAVDAAQRRSLGFRRWLDTWKGKPRL